MRIKRFGNALFEVGYCAAGGTFMILVGCGGVVLWITDIAHNPFLIALAWTMFGTLLGGVFLMGVGHIVREMADEETSGLAARVQALEAEVARLREYTGCAETPVAQSHEVLRGKPNTAIVAGNHRS